MGSDLHQAERLLAECEFHPARRLIGQAVRYFTARKPIDLAGEALLKDMEAWLKKTEF